MKPSTNFTGEATLLLGLFSFTDRQYYRGMSNIHVTVLNGVLMGFAPDCSYKPDEYPYLATHLIPNFGKSITVYTK